MNKNMYIYINSTGQKIKTTGLTMTQYSTNSVLHLITVGRYDNIEVAFRFPSGKISNTYHLVLSGLYEITSDDTQTVLTENANNLYEYTLTVPYAVTSQTVTGTSARINTAFSCFKYNSTTNILEQVAVANSQIIMNASTSSDTLDESYKLTEVDNLWKAVNKVSSDISDVKSGDFDLVNATITGGTATDLNLISPKINGESLDLSQYATKDLMDVTIDQKIAAQNLSTVATTGSYNDLVDKPNIPSTSGLASETYVDNAINSALVSAYKYQGSVATYSDLPTTNQSNGDVYNVESNGMNYAWTGTSWDALGMAIDLTGYYNKEDVDTALSLKANQSTTYTKAEVNSLPVSTFSNDTGYITTDNLTNYATTASVKALPVSTFSNDAGYITTANLTGYATTASVQALPVSTFSNDAGYLTTHQDLSEYAKTADVKALPVSTFSNDSNYATITEVNDKIDAITGINVVVVDTLPDTGEIGTIYLLSHEHTDGTQDIYDEYLWVNSTSTFEKIGNTDIDLTDYAKTADVKALPVSTFSNDAGYLTTHQDLSEYITTDDSRLSDDRKNPNALTIGDKSYDGSEAVTITTDDLGINTNASSITLRQWGGNA